MKYRLFAGTASLVQFAIGSLSFAETVREVSGQGPTNNPATTSREQHVFRVDPSKLSIGTKSKVTKPANELTGVNLPPPKFAIRQVQIDGEDLFECSAVVYGIPRIKDKPQKDPKKGYKLTGEITRQLSLASTISGKPIMVESAEGASERMLIDVPWVDPETGEETTLQFAMIGTAHFYGKLLGEVNYRDREAEKAAAAQNA